MNELIKNLKCLVVRNGIEIWIEEKRANNLINQLPNLTEHKFIDFDGRIINTADLTGVYLPQDMLELTNRKNGMWKCKDNEWHEKDKKCDCYIKHDEVKRKKQIEAYEKCNKCDKGYILKDDNGQEKLFPCECILNIK